MTRGRAMLGGTLLAVLAGLLPALPAGAAVSAAARPPARQLVPLRQLITVTASSRTATSATFRAYDVRGGTRTEVLGPWTARVGYHGIAAAGAKREGDGRTPSGTYGIGFFFGVDANPGVSYPYRRVQAYDEWDDDPASPRYNEWVDTRTASAGRDPEPMRTVPAYDYGAVISYNTAREPGRGSAIFLHQNTGGDTAGCVSLPQSDLLKVLRWLQQDEHPAISIGVS